MLRVTPSTAWPILVMLMAAVAVALVWSVVSHAPQRSEGNGILLTPLGVADIPAEGNVEELKVRPSQKAKAGEFVAARTILRPGSGKGSSTSQIRASSGHCWRRFTRLMRRNARSSSRSRRKPENTHSSVGGACKGGRRAGRSPASASREGPGGAGQDPCRPSPHEGGSIRNSGRANRADAPPPRGVAAAKPNRPRIARVRDQNKRAGTGDNHTQGRDPTQYGVTAPRDGAMSEVAANIGEDWRRPMIRMLPIDETETGTLIGELYVRSEDGKKSAPECSRGSSRRRCARRGTAGSTATCSTSPSSPQRAKA
jgi:hypothetical protein